MEGHEELELKTIVSKEQFEKILENYPDIEFIKQTNTYYKSNNCESYAFRIREKEGLYLFTLKHHNNGTIDEYEKYFVGNIEDDNEIMDLLTKFEEYPPYLVLGTLVTKRAVYDNGYGELCFDINEYNGLVDYEIEYEVHKEHDYQSAFANILKSADISYTPSWGSKYHRFLTTLSKNNESK